MRIAVLATLGLLLAVWLWLGAEPESTPRLPDADPAADGPGLDVRAQPLEADPTRDTAITLLVRRHGAPAQARISLRGADETDLRAIAEDVLDLHGMPEVWSGTTDQDGVARITGLTPGVVQITARGLEGGYATALAQVGAGGGAQTVVLDLLAGPHRFEGRLVNGPRPAPGWRVQLRIATDWDDTEPYGETDPVWSSTTDADGRFAFAALPHGRYVVTALLPGRRSLTFRAVLVPSTGEHAFDVGLEGEASLLGTVRDLDTDAPIPSATVRIESTNAGCLHSETRHTDASGRFEAPVGNWIDSIRVEAVGYAPREFKGRSIEGAEERTIHLARRGHVTGRVVAVRDGRSIAGAGVCLFRWHHSEPDTRWVVSDAEGRFNFADVRPGKVHVFVLGGGHRSATFDTAAKHADPTLCRVSPGQTTELTLEVLPTTTLRGRVVDAQGTPVSGARIVPSPYFAIRGVLTPHRLPTPHTDAEGRFEFTELVPGAQFYAEVHIDGRAQGGARLHVDAAAAPTEIRLEPMRRYVVEVLDATTDAPIPGAVVWVDDERAVYSTQPWLTDASGRVAFDLAHTYFSITSVHALGYQPKMDILVSEPLERTLRLERGAQISGRIELPAGVPPSAVEVALEVNSDDEDLDGSTLVAVLDATGRFTIQGVPPGSHDLSAEATWQGHSYVASLEAAAGDLDVVLSLEAEADERLPPTRIHVRDPRGRDLVRGMAFRFARGPGGRVRHDTALVHAGRAVFRYEGGSPWWMVITPQRDETGLKSELMPALAGPFGLNDRNIAVVLQRGRTIRGRITDPAGRPIAGVELHATVTWRIGQLVEPKEVFVCTTHTDSAGRFALAGLPQETVKVHVLHAPLGWLRPEPSELPATTASWDLTLEPAERALIRVVDWRGAPVRGARVRWVPRRAGWKAADVRKAGTDVRGRAEFGALDPNEPVDLIVVPPDERTDCLTYRLDRAPLEDRLVRLPRGFELEVTVLDARGHPVADAIVWRSTPTGLVARGRTNANGVQGLHSIPEGGIALLATRGPQGAQGAIVYVAADAGACTLRVPD